ncbi:hypothetical protein CEQ90_02875 [Lewinellaceae bacterium SD302]|nr:hypothetical protein CEQ90_02875 [Lewinellaceae bacterium SD302]
MLQSIWDDIKQEFGYGNMIKRIIIVNVAVYVTVNLLWVIMIGSYPELYKGIVHFFSMPSDWLHLLTHPWAPLTHMFLHEGFFHILWNMLFLFWFGRIFGDLLGDRRVLPLYLIGGLGGAIFYFLAANLGAVPGTSFALGASAAVMAILVAAGMTAPDYQIRLLFLGNVKLKWIVVALVFMNVLGTRGISNVGGAWGHLGGIATGFLFAYRLQRGNDMTAPVARLIDKVTDFYHSLRQPKRKSRPGPRAAYRRGEKVKSGSRPSSASKKSSGKRAPKSVSHQEQLDAILDKIKDRGYNSLTQEEKEFLFNASNK